MSSQKSKIKSQKSKVKIKGNGEEGTGNSVGLGWGFKPRLKQSTCVETFCQFDEVVADSVAGARPRATGYVCTSLKLVALVRESGTGNSILPFPVPRSLLPFFGQKAKGNLLLLFSCFLFPFSFSLFPSSAKALPGQSTATVAAWVNANPTLRPGLGDGLRVTKSDSAAQRFTFQATVLPPGRISATRSRSTIRSERMTFYDEINGITLDRLRESLRAIYGTTIYQDYDRAQLVYDYPTPQTVDLARRQNRPLLAAQRGELRLGERFAYWLEITKSDDEKAFSGQITVLLKEDLDKLETELRDR